MCCRSFLESFRSPSSQGKVAWTPAISLYGSGKPSSHLCVRQRLRFRIMLVPCCLLVCCCAYSTLTSTMSCTALLGVPGMHPSDLCTQLVRSVLNIVWMICRCTLSLGVGQSVGLLLTSNTVQVRECQPIATSFSLECCPAPLFSCSRTTMRQSTSGKTYLLYIISQSLSRCEPQAFLHADATHRPTGLFPPPYPFVPLVLLGCLTSMDPQLTRGHAVTRAADSQGADRSCRVLNPKPYAPHVDPMPSPFLVPATLSSNHVPTGLHLDRDHPQPSMPEC